MRLEITKHIKQGGVLIATLVFANFLNFVFSAFLGRVLSLEEFGLVMLFNTLAYFLSIFINSVSGVVNYQTAHLHGKGRLNEGVRGMTRILKKVLLTAVAVTAIWVALSPWLAPFFNIPNISYLLLFAPIFSFGLLAGVLRGYLQGVFRFSDVALLILAETISKLAAAFIFVGLGHEAWVYLSIPISFGVPLLLAAYMVSRFKRKLIDNDDGSSSSDEKYFSLQFFVASILTGLSTAAFLNVDVVMAKHYLSATAAGEYALLSLVGKVVFFGSSLLNIFILTFVRHDEGQNINPSKKFYELLAGSTLLAAVTVLAFDSFGHRLVPLLLGEKSQAILDYVNMYSFAAAAVSLAGAISGYHLARNQFFFSKVAIVFAFVMIGGILFMHDSIGDIVTVFSYTCYAFLLSVVALHLLSKLKYSEAKYHKPILQPIPADARLSVAVCIPSYNEERNIGKLLDALLLQETEHIIINKIVVVSSGSTDNTDAIVKSFTIKDPRVMLLREDKRNGKASAINECLKVVNDPVMVVESADTIPAVRAIELLCLPFLRDEKIGMTGGAPIPVNDPNTFLGYVIHSWWWFHRHIPRFGEIIAYRNVLDEVSPTTAVDEAYIQAKIVQKGMKAVHVDEAVVSNKGSETVRDLIKQRRRIFNGHSRLMKEENIRITNMTKSSLYLLLVQFEMTKVRHLFWLTGGIIIEIWARLLGFVDRYFYAHNPFVWDVAQTTKDLQSVEQIKEENDRV